MSNLRILSDSALRSRLSRRTGQKRMDIIEEIERREKGDVWSLFSDVRPVLLTPQERWKIAFELARVMIQQGGLSPSIPDVMRISEKVCGKPVLEKTQIESLLDAGKNRYRLEMGLFSRGVDSLLK